MSNIALIFLILYLWAQDSGKIIAAQVHPKVISVCNKIFKVLINLELACLALFQIPLFLEFVKANPTFETVLYNFGLLFNYEVSSLNVRYALRLTKSLSSLASWPHLDVVPCNHDRPVRYSCQA